MNTLAHVFPPAYMLHPCTWINFLDEPNLIHSCNHMPISICLPCPYEPTICMYAHAHAKRSPMTHHHAPYAPMGRYKKQLNWILIWFWLNYTIIPHEVGPSIYIYKKIIWEGERKIQQTRTTLFIYNAELWGLVKDARFGCNSYCFLNCDCRLNDIVHNVYQLNTISQLPCFLVYRIAYASWFNFP